MNVHSTPFAAAMVFLASLASVPVVAQNIDVRITADNAYRFGFGSVSSFTAASPNIESFLAGDIFNCSTGPEAYSVPQNPNDYLYIVAYADKATTQGVLGQFQVGSNPKIYTGVGPWEVCAVGTDFDPGSGGPTVPQINADIINCNAGDPLVTSRAWVNTTGTAIGKLQFGEPNGATPQTGPGNEFPQVCTTGSNGIDPAAVWMWYNWDPTNIVWPAQSPFIWPGSAVNIDDEYLIFRLPMQAVPGVTAGIPTLEPVGIAILAALLVCIALRQLARRRSEELKRL